MVNSLEPYKTAKYDEELVAKAIHIIRNPLDNIISRYHLYLKMLARGRIHLEVDLNSSEIKTFSNDAEGFRNWCKVQDNLFPEEEQEMFEQLPFYKLLKQVPCHADFYRYAQWHNLAFTITSNMSIPSMVLYYEDFATDFNQTKDKVFQFIGAEETRSVGRKKHTSFESSGKNYSTYYTPSQKNMIWQLLHFLSTNSTYVSIYSRYKIDQ